MTLSIGAQSCLAAVDALGNAQCTVGIVTAPLGTSIPLGASFAGDTYYLPSADTSKSAVVFAFPSRGDFVLGDSTVAAAGPLDDAHLVELAVDAAEHRQRRAGDDLVQGLRRRPDAVVAARLRRHLDDEAGEQPASGRRHPELHGRARALGDHGVREHDLGQHREDRRRQDQPRLLDEPGPRRHRDVRRDLLRLTARASGEGAAAPSPALPCRGARLAVLAGGGPARLPAREARRPRQDRRSSSSGRVGGNIAPFTVQIRADGTSATPARCGLRIRNVRLSQKRLAALLRLRPLAGLLVAPRLTAVPRLAPRLRVALRHDPHRRQDAARDRPRQLQPTLLARLPRARRRRDRDLLSVRPD